METANKTTIEVETTVNAPLEKAWKYFTEPEHITQWYFASDDWHAPRAENNVIEGGSFVTRMEAKDGSFGFDYGGVYTRVQPNKLLEFKLGDERKVKVEFIDVDGRTRIVESFEAENQHSHELQKTGWQAILDNFKKHTESN